MAEEPPLVVARGRHAPPLQVRLDVQRRRLFLAAAAVCARGGYADLTAEAITREAGMSKATFYEHFANKEECILALMDEATLEVMQAMATASVAVRGDYRQHVRDQLGAFLRTLTEYPTTAQTILVEAVAAGPQAAERRDAMLSVFAESLLRDNARAAQREGAPQFVTRDDAFAVVGATVELISRHLRTGVPQDVLELEPVIERVIFGLLNGERSEPA
jgi:AcrR family transcriptional regulator